ncbi:MAG: hypothetical protein DRH32_03570 [Deltaproteobacteria bacterium]|nr:MAG: hypothetical protein DRH32_03570 [Deltaproteobacteria bacterium]
MKEYPSKYRVPDHRYDRSNRQFEHPQYISHDRQNPNQRKKFTNRRNDPAELLNELFKKTGPELKSRLGEISASQKRLADAEERKAAALEKIAAYFQGAAPADPPGAEPDSEPETAPVPELESGPEQKNGNLSGEQSSAPVQNIEKTVPAPDSTPDSRTINKATDAQRAMALKIIKKMHKENATYNQIALRLEKENLPTFSGRGRWHAQTIHRLLKK